jgi:hypothetical protein
MNGVNRRQVLRLSAISSLGLGASRAARAQSAAVGKLAIVSMIGHDVDVVVSEAQVGSRLPPKRERLPLAAGFFDQRATAAMDKLARRFVAADQIVLLSGQDKMWAELQQDALASAAGMNDMVATLADAARQVGCTQVLALMKWRAVAKLRLARSSIGNGMLEGLGFYIDPKLTTVAEGTQMSSIGVLAPFACMRLLHVDAVQVRALGSETAQASTTVTPPTGTLIDPWDALNSEGKVQMLLDLMEEELGQMVPALLGSTRRKA